MTLHISIALPSRDLEKCPMERAVTRIAERIAIEKRYRRVPDGRALDVSFLLSSENDAPPFTGMRMGGYSAENDTLFFQAAVPPTLSRSAKASLYVSLVLQDVIDNAAEFFGEHGVTFDAMQWRKFFDSVIPLQTRGVMVAPSQTI